MARKYPGHLVPVCRFDFGNDAREILLKILRKRIDDVLELIEPFLAIHSMFEIPRHEKDPKTDAPGVFGDVSRRVSATGSQPDNSRNRGIPSSVFITYVLISSFVRSCIFRRYLFDQSSSSKTARGRLEAQISICGDLIIERRTLEISSSSPTYSSRPSMKKQKRVSMLVLETICSKTDSNAAKSHVS